jgi:hypothetical protein
MRKPRKPPPYYKKKLYRGKLRKEDGGKWGWRTCLCCRKKNGEPKVFWSRNNAHRICDGCVRRHRENNEAETLVHKPIVSAYGGDHWE